MSSQCVPPFCLQELGSSLLSLPWIHFQVDYLFYLYLLGRVVFFNLASSSANYFSVISFCLNYYVYGLPLSTACRAIVPLASVVYALVDEVGPGTYVVFLVGGTGACALVCEAETLLWWSGSHYVVFWGVCKLSVT